MQDDFNNTQPIYLQLVQRICRQIIRGDINTGEKLPSVREMAVVSGVNPNTVQRAYAELERVAVVETKRGLGTFVTKNNDTLRKLREQLKNDQVATFVTEMREMGFTPQEIISGVQSKLLD